MGRGRTTTNARTNPERGARDASRAQATASKSKARSADGGGDASDASDDIEIETARFFLNCRGARRDGSVGRVRRARDDRGRVD